MADLQSLTRIYRRLAQENGGTDLSAQKTWLVTTFMVRASGADAGGFQPSATSFEGGSFSGLFRGASEEERAISLLNAIEEVEAAIAAADAGTVAPPAVATLLPRVITAPI